MPIRLLPEDLVKKIAAGEVIERPASCVKELVENSLDAGAGKISVHLERGGHQMIRIVDDGTGIPPDDLRLSVKHHATSKIASLEDMERIRTLGFRGEALASMAQVARLTVVSRVPGEEMGCQIVVEGGEEKDFGRIGSRKGTEVRVENLFFNTPARKKFLRKESTELKSVLKLVTELALFNHGKAFEVMSNGKEIFSVRSRPTAEERIGEILGEDVQESLVVFEKELPAVRIKGFLSSQERMQRTHQYFFVNG
ncbi:MAG TPA: DNA mismatch repair endonuclease MutL, partial [bacterium]|nr:DNA mismatch repair endonuclease MutL [bacterium]